MISALGREAGPGEFVVLVVFVFLDRLRAEARDVIEHLSSRRIETVMLSGDSTANAERIGQELGIARAHGDLSPADKLERVRALADSGKTVVMIGDGINDSVALAAADVGISFAASSEIAAHSSDVLLIGADLNRLQMLLDLARRVRRKMIQNLSLAFGYNLVLLPLAFLGLVIRIVAAILMAISSITVTVNSMTLLKTRA